MNQWMREYYYYSMYNILFDDYRSSDWSAYMIYAKLGCT